jgi:diguanylate cyclase (GGDEF)-like protein/PAS domain S-box-containing protein
MLIDIYKDIFNSLTYSIAVYKVINDGEDFEFVEFNKAAESLDQIKKEQLLGKKVSEVFPGVKDMGLFDVFVNVYKSAETQEHPFKLYSDGKLTGWRKNIVSKLDNDHIVAIYSDKFDQKKYENELRSAKLEIEQIFNKATSAIAYVNRDGIITKRNAKFVELFGYTYDDVSDIDSWYMMAYPDEDYRNKVLSIWNDKSQTALKNNADIKEHEYKIICKNGEEKSVLISGFFLNGGIVATFIDVTQQRKMELEKKKKELYYHQLFEANRGVMLFIDYENNGKILNANRSALEFYGYTLEEITNKSIKDINIFSSQEIDEEMNKAREESRSCFYFKHKLKSGEIRDVEVLSGPLNIEGRNILYSIVHDITEKKELEKALEKKEDMYRKLMKYSSDGLFLMNMDGRLLESSYQAQNLLGYSEEEMKSLYVYEWDISHNKDELIKLIRSITTEPFSFETRHIRKDGTVYDAAITVVKINIDSQDMVYASVRDITEQKNKEKITLLRQKLTEISKNNDQDKLMRTALDAAESITGSQIGFFHFVDHDQENVSLQVWSTNTLKKMCFAQGHSFHYPISQAGVWVDCIHERKPVIHNDYESLPHKKGLPKGHAKLVRELTVPIFKDGLIVAIIGVGNKNIDYSDYDIKLVEEIAYMAFEFVEFQRIEDQVKYMAYNDVLTDLPNRALLVERLHSAMKSHKNSNQTLAVCYLDLDGFKPVNDRFGHHIGDDLLIAFAKRITENLREGDTFARLGGDEFVLLLTGLNHSNEYIEVLNRVMDLIHIPFDIDGHRIHISASFGVTLYPLDDNDADTLLRHSDQAMYIAKQDKSIFYSLYQPVLDKDIEFHKQTIQEFEEALNDDQLLLYYQPKIDLKTAEVIGMEALIRWEHPKDGLLVPFRFLPLIENTPQEIALGEWVIKSALKQLAQWRELGYKLNVSVNISPRHIQLESLSSFLISELNKYPKELAQSFEMEILEIADISDFEKVSQNMKECIEQGVRFSLDDFGTGYSSLTYFHKLPIDVLKIDQNFVKNILDNKSDLDIVEGVVHLSKAINKPVIAEGVESIEIAAILLSLECEYAQGYGISRPMPEQAVVPWLREWKNSDDWSSLKTYKDKYINKSQINTALFSHQRWLKSVIKYIESNAVSYKPNFDENECQLGLWYKGIGREIYGSKESYAFIQAKHNKVHEFAITLKKMVDSGEQEKALSNIGELKYYSDDLLNLLKTLDT